MKRKWGAVAACALASAVLCSFTGCADRASSSNGNIYLIVKSKQSPEYWDVVKNGAVDAAAEVGYNIIYDAPESEADIDDQIAMVDKAVQEKAAAIVVAPTNTEDLNDCISNAVSAGVPVVTVDARCSLEDIVYIGTDNWAAGVVAGREAKGILKDTKKVAIIALQEGSAVSDERSGGFIDEMTGTAEVLETTYCNAERDVAKSQAIELINKYPDLEMIYAVNQGSTLGACDAIAELGVADKVTLIGFDSCDESISFLKSGVLDGFVVQNPYNMGYLGVRNADKMINGGNVALTIDTGTTFVDLDNLNDADVQLLLFPLGKNE